MGHEGPTSWLQRFRHGQALTAAANVVVAVLGAGAAILAARLFGASGRGIVAAVQILPSLLMTTAQLGVGDGIVFQAAHQPDRVREIAASGAAAGFGGFLLMLPVGVAAVTAVTPYGNEVEQAAMRFLMIGAAYSVAGSPIHALRGIGRFDLYNGLRLIPPALWLAVVLAEGGFGGADPIAACDVYLLLLLASSVPIWLLFIRATRGSVRIDLNMARQAVRFGLPVAIAAIPAQTTLRIDQGIIGRSVPAAELGVYAALVGWSALVGPLASAVGHHMFPDVIRAGTEGRALLGRGVRRAATIAGASVVVGLVASPMAIPFLLGDEFAGHHATTSLLLLASALAVVNEVRGQGMRALGLRWQLFSAEAIGAVATLVGLALLVPSLGILGAALVSLGAYALVGAVQGVAIRSGRQRAGSGLPDPDDPPPVAPSGDAL